MQAMPGLLSAGTPLRRPGIDSRKSPFEIGLEIVERLGRRRATGDHDVIEVAARVILTQLTDRRLKPPTDPVAPNRVSDFLRHGEAETRTILPRLARPLIWCRC